MCGNVGKGCHIIGRDVFISPPESDKDVGIVRKERDKGERIDVTGRDVVMSPRETSKI